MDHKQWRSEFDDLIARMDKRSKRMIRFNKVAIVSQVILLVIAIVVFIIGNAPTL